MIPLTLGEIASVTGGRVAGDATGEREAVVVSGDAVIDSRAAGPAGLFVAVVGEHTDGHEYAAQAVAAGAVAVLGSRPTGVPTVVVPDPVVALGVLARHAAAGIPGLRTLALTGSQGKTGTKDYLAAVLAPLAPTVATAGNHNNEIGVPLTVLRTTAATRYLVTEMGARGRGHIGYLCSLARPDVAAVLNVGTAHLAEFGSREAIAASKGEIVEALPGDGVAVLNADDELVASMAARTQARVLSFGRDAEVSWSAVELDDLGRPTFRLGYAGAQHPVRLVAVGAHQVPNATAAAAMALAAGVDVAAVVTGLEAARPASRWRMELHERADGALVINDAYNANPDSMRAGLEALAGIGARRSRRTVAVLGEMRELGETADEAHREVGRAAARLGVDVLVAVDAPAHPIAAGAVEIGDWHGLALRTADRDDAEAWVREHVSGGDVVLVKASRGAALEQVAQALLEARVVSTGSTTDQAGDVR